MPDRIGPLVACARPAANEGGVFDRVLVANRGEIARRVMRTCRRLGIGTVAVYSDADADAPHVREADHAVRLGPPPPADSYLVVEAVVDAAARAGAQAIHPGYGFLAESPALATACADAGVTFVGPPAATLRLMGDKAAAKTHLEAAGVPVIPGEHHPDGLSDDGLVAAGSRLGFPLLVKAVAGGGGTGLRRVDRPEALPAAAAAVRREAAAAFGDRRVLVEKLVSRPRHIEVQVFGDTHGEVVHLFERECSIQRRHQKIVEESPSPTMDDDLRRRMCTTAVLAAGAVDYRGAGTVEMLLCETTGCFYFLEMNTRLQVEHPVTELTVRVGGEQRPVDLVEWQLRVAAGEPLPAAQEEITVRGHAVEARLYAEDPAAGFLPQTGRLVAVELPADEAGLRVDAAAETASHVSSHYDPLLAKLIAAGPDRPTALRRLAALINRSTVFGVTTNLGFLLDVVTHPAFRAGKLTTGFVDEHLPGWSPPAPSAELLAGTAAVLVDHHRTHPHARPDPWQRLGPWRLGGIGGWRVTVRDHRGADHRLVVTGRGDRLTVVTEAPTSTRSGSSGESGGPVREVRVAGRTGGHPPRWQLVVDDQDLTLTAVVSSDEDPPVVWLHDGVRVTRLTVVPTSRRRDPGLTAAGRALVSPLPGRVAAVQVTAGQEVPAGTPLVVIEAMKMEHPVAAPAAAKVVAVHVRDGQAVEAGQPLIEVEPLAERFPGGPPDGDGPG